MYASQDDAFCTFETRKRVSSLQTALMKVQLGSDLMNFVKDEEDKIIATMRK
jgi:hypothetical protein